MVFTGCLINSQGSGWGISKKCEIRILNGKNRLKRASLKNLKEIPTSTCIRENKVWIS